MDCASRQLPVVYRSVCGTWWRGDAQRAEECEQMVQILVTQAIDAEVGHQRLLVASDLPEIYLQVSLQPPRGIHNLNREGVLTFAGSPNLLAVFRHQPDRLISDRE